MRRRLVCAGAVQGVGFRPAVYRLATALGLDGEVRNDADGATVEVEGAPALVARFERELEAALPPLARLARVEARDLAPRRAAGFRVEESWVAGRRGALVPPDARVCAACRAELDDPRDRRHRYPFTTCTDCGPRFTLVRALPYDRARTSMAPFPLCPACAREYADPQSRRFHAEALCCPACGPTLRALGRGDAVLDVDAAALARARATLARGGAVALHGLGGFQLCCRADDERAVRRLRRIKRRDARPFALMARDLAAAGRLVTLRAADAALLESARAPILLAPRRSDARVAPSVAPGLADLGLMLPTTPLHVELFRGAPYDALVATSGNLADEPICRTVGQARARLGGRADLVLAHDREVVRRADDSVARAMPGGHALLRRSRGWVPEPLPLPVSAPAPVLALGGHLQTTACLAVGDLAFPSQHVGDLDTEAAREFLLEVARGLEEFLEARAEAVAVDLHPDYPSSWVGEQLARARGGRLVRVQHHLAHAAAVLAEHGRFPRPGARAAALVLDGTGYGVDADGRASAWGAELLLIEGDLRWRRLAHGEELPLVGGEAAVREPWRVACAALARVEDLELLLRGPLAERVPRRDLLAVARLSRADAWPRACGAGRAFEAAGALCGLAARNGYEGQAAARLEALASGAPDDVPAWPEVRLAPGAHTLPTARLLAACARRLRVEPAAAVAAGFHASYVALAAELAARVLPADARLVALGGGCLVNRRLSAGLVAALAARGFEPLLPRAVPPGDGGLSYGQAAVAAAALALGREPLLQEGP